LNLLETLLLARFTYKGLANAFEQPRRRPDYVGAQQCFDLILLTFNMMQVQKKGNQEDHPLIGDHVAWHLLKQE
jgi:hypothetical protein